MKCRTVEAAHQRKVDEYVEWLARNKPAAYADLLYMVHAHDAQPDVTELEMNEAIASAIRRRERAEACAGREAACDEGGVWRRTSYGTDHGTVVVAPRRVRSRSGRAPRRATNAHSRGSRRGQRATSSSSDDPDPPSAARICQCGECGRDISHLRTGAKYFEAACRKRTQRKRDKATPDRIWQRKAKRLAAAEALGPGERTAENLPKGCRCFSRGVDPGFNKGSETDPEGDLICVACGRPLELGGSSPNGYDARMAKVRELMRNDAAVALGHGHRKRRQWQTRRRSRAAKLSAENRRKRKDGEYQWVEAAAREEVAA
jgi:hypothetical protein